MISILLVILASALLYRVPRGGPEGSLWRSWGLAWVGRLNEEIWALGTAGMLAVAFGEPWLVGLAVPLWAGEKPGYMHHIRWFIQSGGADPRYEVDAWRMNLRGLLMLNPVMGHIYQFWLSRRPPTFGWFLDGQTAYAELTCGLVTATAYGGVAWLITSLI